MSLLDTLSRMPDTFTTRGVCDSLQRQLSLLPAHTNQYLLSCPNDYPSVASKLFEKWLSTKAIAMEDDERKDKLISIFREKMQREDIVLEFGQLVEVIISKVQKHLFFFWKK